MDALIVFFLFNYFFIVLAIVIGLIAVEWILFERAGEPGWKVLVPFYVASSCTRLPLVKILNGIGS